MSHAQVISCISDVLEKLKTVCKRKIAGGVVICNELYLYIYDFDKALKQHSGVTQIIH